MHGSNLLKLLQTLTKKDRREIKKIVASPYFNTREDVQMLYDLIDTHLDNAGTKIILSKEWLFSGIYKGKKFDAQKINQVASLLTDIIKRYLIISEIENNQQQGDLLLLKALRHRKADKHFDKEYKNSIEELEKSKIKNAQFYLSKYSILFEEYQNKSQQERTAELNLQILSDTLDSFYVLESLKIACSIAAHKKISKYEYKQEIFNNLLDKIESLNFLNNFNIEAYYNAHLTQLYDKKDKNFDVLKSILINEKLSLDNSEQRILYVAAINYCIKQMNNSQDKFIFEAIELYEKGLNNGILLNDNNLSPYTYRNVLMSYLKVSDFQKAKAFLEVYKSYLPKTEREDVYIYNLAIWYFRQDNFDEAMQLLQTSMPKENLLHLDARRLLLRIYFEKQEYSALDSLIESTKQYIYTKKELGYHKEAYKNFLSFLQKVIKLDPRDKEKKAILRGEVEKTKLLAEKAWLLQILS